MKNEEVGYNDKKKKHTEKSVTYEEGKHRKSKGYTKSDDNMDTDYDVYGEKKHDTEDSDSRNTFSRKKHKFTHDEKKENSDDSDIVDSKENSKKNELVEKHKVSDSKNIDDSERDGNNEESQEENSDERDNNERNNDEFDRKNNHGRRKQRRERRKKGRKIKQMKDENSGNEYGKIKKNYETKEEDEMNENEEKDDSDEMEKDEEERNGNDEKYKHGERSDKKILDEETIYRNDAPRNGHGTVYGKRRYLKKSQKEENKKSKVEKSFEDYDNDESKTEPKESKHIRKNRKSRKLESKKSETEDKGNDESDSRHDESGKRKQNGKDSWRPRHNKNDEISKRKHKSESEDETTEGTKHDNDIDEKDDRLKEHKSRERDWNDDGINEHPSRRKHENQEISMDKDDSSGSENDNGGYLNDHLNGHGHHAIMSDKGDSRDNFSRKKDKPDMENKKDHSNREENEMDHGRGDGNGIRDTWINQDKKGNTKEQSDDDGDEMRSSENNEDDDKYHTKERTIKEKEYDDDMGTEKDKYDHFGHKGDRPRDHHSNDVNEKEDNNDQHYNEKKSDLDRLGDTEDKYGGSGSNQGKRVHWAERDSKKYDLDEQRDKEHHHDDEGLDYRKHKADHEHSKVDEEDQARDEEAEKNSDTFGDKDFHSSDKKESKDDNYGKKYNEDSARKKSRIEEKADYEKERGHEKVRLKDLSSNMDHSKKHKISGDHSKDDYGNTVDHEDGRDTKESNHHEHDNVRDSKDGKGNIWDHDVNKESNHRERDNRGNSKDDKGNIGDHEDDMENQEANHHEQDNLRDSKDDKGNIGDNKDKGNIGYHKNDKDNKETNHHEQDNLMEPKDDKGSIRDHEDDRNNKEHNLHEQDIERDFKDVKGNKVDREEANNNKKLHKHYKGDMEDRKVDSENNRDSKGDTEDTKYGKNRQRDPNADEENHGSLKGGKDTLDDGENDKRNKNERRNKSRENEDNISERKEIESSDIKNGKDLAGKKQPLREEKHREGDSKLGNSKQEHDKETADKGDFTSKSNTRNADFKKDSAVGQRNSTKSNSRHNVADIDRKNKIKGTQNGQDKIEHESNDKNLKQGLKRIDEKPKLSSSRLKDSGKISDHKNSTERKMNTEFPVHNKSLYHTLKDLDGQESDFHNVPHSHRDIMNVNQNYTDNLGNNSSSSKGIDDERHADKTKYYNQEANKWKESSSKEDNVEDHGKYYSQMTKHWMSSQPKNKSVEYFHKMTPGLNWKNKTGSPGLGKYFNQRTKEWIVKKENGSHTDSKKHEQNHQRVSGTKSHRPERVPKENKQKKKSQGGLMEYNKFHETRQNVTDFKGKIHGHKKEKPFHVSQDKNDLRQNYSPKPGHNKTSWEVQPSRDGQNEHKSKSNEVLVNGGLQHTSKKKEKNNTISKGAFGNKPSNRNGKQDGVIVTKTGNEGKDQKWSDEKVKNEILKLIGQSPTESTSTKRRKSKHLNNGQPGFRKTPMFSNHKNSAARTVKITKPDRQRTINGFPARKQISSAKPKHKFQGLISPLAYTHYQNNGKLLKSRLPLAVANKNNLGRILENRKKSQSQQAFKSPLIGKKQSRANLAKKRKFFGGKPLGEQKLGNPPKKSNVLKPMTSNQDSYPIPDALTNPRRIIIGKSRKTQTNKNMNNLAKPLPKLFDNSWIQGRTAVSPTPYTPTASSVQNWDTKGNVFGDKWKESGYSWPQYYPNTNKQTPTATPTSSWNNMNWYSKNNEQPNNIGNLGSGGVENQNGIIKTTPASYLNTELPMGVDGDKNTFNKDSWKPEAGNLYGRRAGVQRVMNPFPTPTPRPNYVYDSSEHNEKLFPVGQNDDGQTTAPTKSGKIFDTQKFFQPVVNRSSYNTWKKKVGPQVGQSTSRIHIVPNQNKGNQY